MASSSTKAICTGHGRSNEALSEKWVFKTLHRHIPVSFKAPLHAYDDRERTKPALHRISSVAKAPVAFTLFS